MWPETELFEKLIEDYAMTLLSAFNGLSHLSLLWGVDEGIVSLTPKSVGRVFPSDRGNTRMFSFVKAMSDSSPSASSTGKPPPITTHNTFGSQELFEAWAKDSFINQSTIDILVKTHEIDCLPAVLALKKEDFPDLNLPVGQRRLLENAVEKLRQECELVQPPTPKAKINLEMPSYKSMLEIGEPFDEEEVLRHSGAFQRKSTSVHDFRGRDIGQKILEHAKSHTKTEKDEDNYGPEKEALLLSQKRKSSPQMQSGLKTG